MIDTIENGTHTYMPESYVVPEDPLIRDRLEWFRDQKLALMMHWGIYSQPGICESWPLVDEDKSWSRSEIDWTEGEDFKKEYISLNKSFNPVRFEPEKWADLAADSGFRYLIFTTKHHDGFCMYDSKYSDFKVTAPDCPFHTNKRADIVRNVFDAFRAKGLAIAAFFSKPDWHHPDYWDNCGIGYYTTRMPSYDVKSNPERWNNFASYTKNQIVELVRDYGPVDIIWLDGGQVQRNCGLDINIEDIIAEARKYNPLLLSADRTAGGPCENIITPEQTVPAQPLACPWESCITMSDAFSYRFDTDYKSPRTLIHLLLDIVSKNGNLALNVAPGPDGRIPKPAIERMKAMGAWLKANGDGIYGTRAAYPYRCGEWAFTAKSGRLYAFRLWREGEKQYSFTIPAKAGNISSVKHLSDGVSLEYSVSEDGIEVKLPEGTKTDDIADGFVIE